jgi:hypothetical protein
MGVRVGLSILAICAAVAGAACNSGSLSPNSVCGGSIFLVIADGKSSTFAVGDSVTLIAQHGVLGPGVGSTGCRIQNIPAASVSWTTSDTAIVRVAADGSARGLSAGKADVTATYGGLSATLTLTILP